MGSSAENQETSMDEEKVKPSKPICEFCGKRFKNLRALCGHKRSHSLKGHQKHEFEMGIQDNHQSYDFGASSKEMGNFCHKCDKGFKSFKALHGHMRAHSKRNLGAAAARLKLPNNLPKEKRSVRRYKINTCSINYYSCPNWNNFSCGVDEQELKEIASSLLMLAKGGFYSADNVSVDSEFVEPSCDGIDFNENDFSMKRVKFDDCGTNSDAVKSGYVSVEEVAGFLGFNSDDCNIRQEHALGLTSAEMMNQSTGVPQVGSSFETRDHSIEETLCEFRRISGLNAADSSSMLKHICKTCEKGFPSGQALGGHQAYCLRLKRSFTTETEFHSETVKLRNARRKKKAKDFVCSVCCKEFQSGQALGGHMRAHFSGNSQSCEKKNDAFDHDSRASEGEVGLNHVHNPHSLPALVPVA